MDGSNHVEAWIEIAALLLSCSQINVSSVEELESFIEQIMAVPLLMRVLAHFFHNDYFGAAQPERRFEGMCSCAIQ